MSTGQLSAILSASVPGNMFTKNKINRPVKYWAPVVVWCGLIFTLSSIPHLSTGWGGWDMLLRKCAHMVEYAVLFLLTNRALGGTTAWPGKKCLFGALFFAVLYAASDEFHQSFTAGRHPALQDVGIDSFGALLFLLALVLWLRGQRARAGATRQDQD